MMIVSLTAPRKGMGQTVTAINIAAALSMHQNSRTLLVDINKYCRDAEYYLSDAGVTKGLDDFISLSGAGMLNPSIFQTCVKKAREVDLMTGNQYTELDEQIVSELLEYAGKSYSSIVVDTISGTNQSSMYFLKHSDIILVVLNQNKNAVQMMADMESYMRFTDRLVFVVNRYMTGKGGKRAGYTLSSITDHLRLLGFRNRVHLLDFDMDIMNECNSNMVMELVSNRNSTDSSYGKQLFEIVDDMLLRCGISSPREDPNRLGPMERKPLFGLLSRVRRGLNA